MAFTGLYIKRHAGPKSTALRHQPLYAHTRAALALNKSLSLSLTLKGAAEAASFLRFSIIFQFLNDFFNSNALAHY